MNGAVKELLRLDFALQVGYESLKLRRNNL